MKRFIGILFIIPFIIPIHSQSNTYKNIVFEGASIRGIAYSGVIKELEKAGLIEELEKVGGTSAGAITALALSIGYTADEIYEIIGNTRFQKFNDFGVRKLNSKFGIYKGNKFNDWLGDIIIAKTGYLDITFSELEARGYKDLYVTGTCLNQQKLIVFSKETYPDMKIKDAVRISMSVPLYFEAIFIDSVGNVYENPKGISDLDIVVDGGIIGNFPIFLFDSIYTDKDGKNIRIPNPQTLGVRIDSDSQIESDGRNHELVPMEIEKLSDFVEAFYILALENLNRNTLIKEDWDRTISVSSVGIGPRIKKMSEEEKQRLMRSGESSSRDFLGL